MMARRIGLRQPRNTAPMWKKVAIVLSAPVAVIVVTKLLHASSWNILPFLALVVVVVVATVWLMSRLLGVHLSLRSWD
jgi:membrane protein YdbS with pleckstrin-like domain